MVFFQTEKSICVLFYQVDFLEKILDFVFLKAEHTCHCYWVSLARLLL